MLKVYGFSKVNAVARGQHPRLARAVGARRSSCHSNWSAWTIPGAT